MHIRSHRSIWVVGGLCLATAAPALASEAAHHWSYTGATGPQKWGAMEADYAACSAGKKQSPIDIKTTGAHLEALPSLSFHYKPAPLHIIDNGHTIQVNYPPGSSMMVGEHSYQLVQFHFHKPGEERFDGKAPSMVAHLVHRDAEGHLAVVAVPLRPGHENALIATLWHNLPKEKEHERAVALSVDASGLLPANHGYFTYQGSLTTPPCTEGVRWFVMKTPVTVSPEEVNAFGKIYAANARPVQPLNGRQVVASK